MLIKHPAVAQAAVIGVADEQKGEVVQGLPRARAPACQPTAEEIIIWRGRKHVGLQGAERSSNSAICFRPRAPARSCGSAQVDQMTPHKDCI